MYSRSTFVRLCVQKGRFVSSGLFGAVSAHPAHWTEPGDLADAAALSALDQALWDVAAQRAGQSVAMMLGGERRARISLYANVNRRTVDRSPAGFAASAADAVGAGFDAVKIAPFDEVIPGRGGPIGPGLARIAAVREAIGPRRDLMIDCHWRLDEASAAAVISACEPHRLHWVECPLPEVPGNLSALRRLRGLAHARGMQLAGCETAVGRGGFTPFLRAGAYDVMMPDVKYVGGLAEVMWVSEELAAAGVGFSPHNPTGPVCHAASLQVCAAAGMMDRLEVQFDETPEFEALAGGRLPQAEDGASGLPGGTGLGVRIAAEPVTRLRIGGLMLTP